jgi:anti-sigma regulatory factor (Ser/Thr protein kinase)
VITRQQIRAVLGAGGQVVDSAGQRVGRIVQVVLSAETYQPAWMAVACEPGRVVVVPLAAARRLDGCVQLPYTAAAVRGAPAADGVIDRLTAERAEELAGYFSSLDGRARPTDGHADLDGDPDLDGHREPRDGHVPGRPRRQAFAEAPAAAAPARSGPGTPAPSTNAYRRMSAAGPGLVPVLRGLGIRTGRDAPVAYPGDGAGPWPTLATSSPEPPWWERRQWRWPSAPSSIRAMRLELRPLLDTTGLPADDLDDLTLAASEAAANAVEHAQLSDQRYFDVLTEVGEDWAGIVVQDHGHWRASSGEGDRGRGLYLMGVLADATLTVGSGGPTVVLRNRPGAAR